MSWDIYIMDFPSSVKTIADIPEDFEGPAIGLRDEVISRIREILPVDFSDPSWGILDDAGSSIEFNMGPEKICTSIMLHVRGGGDPVSLVARLVEHLNLRAIDFQTGQFFSTAVAKTSFANWQAYRDQITSGVRPQG